MIMRYFCASNPTFLLIFTCLVLLQSSSSTAQDILNFCTNYYVINSTSGSQFQTNLNLLVPSLVSNGSRNGFFNTSSGDNPNTVYGLVQCKGGISMADCSTCLNSAGKEITIQCSNGKRAFIRFDNCLLRYADNNFFSQVKTSPTNLMPGLDDAPNVEDFNQQVEILMKRVTTDAASKPSKFQVGLINYTNSGPIYGLGQCTRDLSETDCLTCLQHMTNTVFISCRGKEGCQAICASCLVRYEVSSFFDTSLLPPSPPPPPPPVPWSSQTNTTGGKSSKKVVVIVVPIAVVVLVLLSAFFAYSRWRKLSRGKNKSGMNGDNITPEESLQFPLGTIRSATNYFADANKLGKGGFGVVYKGTLSNGQEIAVKRLSQSSGQGSEEFKNEVMLLNKLQHRNLVKLLGFCLERKETLLIYEYVPNGSLDKYLFHPTKKVCLDWETRYKIIRGIARGMLYLHEDSRQRIIHRDLKASNILLDDEMHAQISDFGMARLFGVNQTHDLTKRVAGTFGYMAPEYILQGIISVKLDVYSFGCLVLEIISGQQIINENQLESTKDLMNIAWEQWREGTALQFLDTSLGTGSSTEVMKCLHIGLLCIQNNIEDRPTMASVVLMLDSDSPTLATPSPPPFLMETETLLMLGSGSAT